MNYLLITLTSILISIQSVFQKQYSIKSSQVNIYLFSSFSNLTAALFFLITSSKGLTFSPDVLPYTLLFVAFCTLYSVSYVSAIHQGSIALSNLVISYSLTIPTLYGIIFLKDSVGIFSFLGIVFLCIAIFLLNRKKEKDTISIKWFVSISVAFISNGMCSTVQKMFQLEFGSAYRSEFMICAYLISAAILIFIYLIKTTKNKCRFEPCLAYAGANGAANGAVNLLVLILTGTVPNAILFPLISAFGILISLFFALFLYKEKLSTIQIIGYVTGIISVVFLNF